MPTRATVPNPAQPAQQAGVASRGGRELPDAEQPADGIQRGGDMGICVSARAAGNCGATGHGACFFYDGHSHPFLRLRGGTHPLARRTCEPRPLVQAGQIRPAPPAGAVKTWGPADRSSRRTARAASAESEVRPGPRPPTLRPHHRKTAQAGPEAQSTSSLPIISAGLRLGVVQYRRSDCLVRCVRQLDLHHSFHPGCQLPASIHAMALGRAAALMGNAPGERSPVPGQMPGLEAVRAV